MKKSLTIALLIVLISCTGESDEMANSSWEDVQTSGEGVVTLYYVPSDGFSYYTGNDRLTGVTIEIFRDFIDYVNVEHDVDVTIHYKPVEQFSNFYQTVKNSIGGVFGVANVTITEERKNELMFSPSYMTNIATLITNSETQKLASIEEISTVFRSLDALAFKGTLHEERLIRIKESYLPDIEIHYAESNNEIIDRVSVSNSYFAYIDIYNYWRALDDGAPLQRHAPGDISSEEFGIIMPLNSDWTVLMENFFDAGDGYRNSDRYRSIFVEHLGNELTEILLGYNSRM